MMVALPACKETPTSVGLNVLPSKDKPGIRVDTVPAASYSTVFTSISTFGSDRLLVGKYPGYNSMSTIRFTGLPAGQLDTVTITSAYIALRAVYHFGDATAPLAFQGFELIASPDSATYDSLTTMPANYYSPTPVLVYPPNVLDDTSTIRCLIDTGVVHNWFAVSPSIPNYGVILIATNVGTIKGFGSFSNPTAAYYPTLVVTFLDGGISDTISYSAGESRFVADVPVANLIASDPSSMFVQSGVAYRAQLAFNLHSLPKAGLILKADLELTFNAGSSNLNSFSSDTLYSYFVASDTTAATLPVEGQTITSGSYKIYSFEVADYVRSWANGDTLQRLQFGGLRESSSLDLFALFGTNSPAAVRPRLIITSVAQ